MRSTDGSHGRYGADAHGRVRVTTASSVLTVTAAAIAVGTSLGCSGEGTARSQISNERIALLCAHPVATRDPGSSSPSDAQSDLDGYPCRITVTATGLRFLGTVDGVVPDPQLPIRRLSDGRYVSRSRKEGQLLFWDSAGSFLSSFGTEGEGPGEIDGWFQFLVDRSDSIHARDSRANWHVFGPDGGHSRTMREAQFGPPFPEVAVAFLDDGRLIASEPSLARVVDGRFRIVSRMNEVLKSFGRIPSVDGRAPNPRALSTRVAYQGGDRFWAASPGRFVFQEWDTAGVLISELDPASGFFEDTGEGDVQRPGPVRDQILEITLHGDLLWVRSALARDNVASTLSEAQMELVASGASPYVGRVDVFDLRTRTQLAAASYPSDTVLPWGETLGDGTGLGWRSFESAEGMLGYEIVRFGLTGSR